MRSDKKLLMMKEIPIREKNSSKNTNKHLLTVYLLVSRGSGGT